MQHKPDARIIRNAAGEMVALVRPSCAPGVEAADVELAPCPFCARSDMLYPEHVEGTILHPTYYIHCDYCGVNGPKSDKGNHATLWNRRNGAAEDTKAMSMLKTCVSRLTNALIEVKNAIIMGGSGERPAVVDTLWMPKHTDGTVIEYIDSELANEENQGEQGCLNLVSDTEKPGKQES